MAAKTSPNQDKTDEYGIERAHADNPGVIDKLRRKWDWFDHVMRMQDRYSKNGGNQYSAGITYFSVLSMFPLLMLIFAVIATVLASRPDLIAEVQERIANSVDASMADTLNKIIDTAIEQRGAVAGIGGITALLSGLGWMNNLRYGVSKMWNYPVVGGNFVLMKLRDLLALIGLLLAMVIAFGVTAIGNPGLTLRILTWLKLDEVPGISVIVFLVTLVIALIANYLVFFWMLKALPRGEVPNKVAARASLIGAVAFEIFKQFGSIFFTKALSNPAGATFGPIIGVMVLFYFLWRIVLYCSAWAATTPEALAIAKVDAPGPAVIRVRNEVRTNSGKNLAKGLFLGAACTALLSAFRR